jgi:hypothetical protein
MVSKSREDLMSGSKRRSVFVAVALVVALLPAVPASALTSEACPSTIPSAGFNDLGGLIPDARDAINCVAFYKIALGTSNNTFSPNADVSRWQMALFLVRSASALGVALPNGSNQGFIDISGFDAATQLAINQLKQLGITLGTSATTFDPNGTVPRWQMALFLVRLMAKAGVSIPNGASQGFTDIGGFDSTTQTAINQLRQLGITVGTSPTTFDPLGRVLRWQMALFLARGVNTGGGFPYKIALTTLTPSAATNNSLLLTITVRNPDGTPAAGRRVDVFVAASINANGQCVLDADASINGSDAGTSTNCTIDNNDPVTNNQGVATVTLSHNATAEVDTVYAWTGENGEAFNLSAVRGEAIHTVTWVTPPTALSLGDDRLAPYGTSVTITAQFRAAGQALAFEGQPVRFRVVRNAATIHNVQVLTNAAGSATFTYTGPSDPSGGNDLTNDTITAFWDKDFDGVDDGAAELDDTMTLGWDDDAPALTSLTVTQSSLTGLVNTSVTITATALSQYGAPLSGVTVEFNPDSTGATTVNTNASGIAQRTYTGPGTNLADGVVVTAAPLAPQTVTHYWVEEHPNAGIANNSDILAFHTTQDWIDINSGGSFYRILFDSNDTLRSGVGTGGTPLVNLSTFRSHLSNATRVVGDTYASGGSSEIIIND